MRILDDEPDLPAQINIVPMIDVIFAILAFFIMSTLFLTRSEGLPVNLPQASSSQQQQESPATLTIDAQGNLFLNREAIDPEGLMAAIQDLQGDKANFLVIVNADEAVPHGIVVKAMDQIRQVPGARLAIATVKP
ncbi:MAG: ExbD/TolR family protein [Prochlorotrichaceae cyanobacterium]|jgi:biopolymer transport protein ExbD